MRTQNHAGMPRMHRGNQTNSTQNHSNIKNRQTQNQQTANDNNAYTNSFPQFGNSRQGMNQLVSMLMQMLQ